MRTKQDVNRDLTEFGRGVENESERASESAARTGPAGDECTCHPRWLDAYDAGDVDLMCFPCERTSFRERDEYGAERRGDGA